MVEPPKPPNVVPLNAPDGEAAAWVARLDADPSPELISEFDAWKNQSRAHREAADRLSDLWSELDVLSELKDLAPLAQPVRRAGAGVRGGKLLRRGAAAAVAASLVIGVGVYRMMAPEPARSYATPLGKQQTITLADGSTVQLNTNSVVEVSFKRDARDVRLVRGEAFFEVSPDHRRPFTVYTPEGSVQAVGTAFAVRLEHGAVRVTLTKGTVRLRRIEQAAAAGARPVETGSAILSAQSGRHTEAKITPAGIDREVVNSETVARELSWRQGILVFDGEPLAQMVADVSRYTDVQIEIAHPKLRDVKVDGYFDAGDVEQMLQALEAGFGVRVVRLGPKRVQLTAAEG